jgi:hypothetical protein
MALYQVTPRRPLRLAKASLSARPAGASSEHIVNQADNVMADDTREEDRRVARRGLTPAPRRIIGGRRIFVQKESLE